MSEKQSMKRIRGKLSKIEFPEICPVCLKPVKDLVSVSFAITSDDEDKSSLGIREWRKSSDSTGVTLSVLQGSVLVWIPTCMFHGSRTMVSQRTMMTTAISFFILFYPLLYYILGIITALQYARPLLEVLVPFVVILVIQIVIFVYGFFPRALQRSIEIVSINQTRDEIIFKFRNNGYQAKFLEQNAMYTEIID